MAYVVPDYDASVECIVCASDESEAPLYEPTCTLDLGLDLERRLVFIRLALTSVAFDIRYLP